MKHHLFEFLTAPAVAWLAICAWALNVSFVLGNDGDAFRAIDGDGEGE